jgi:hypothetical protein
MDGGFFILPLHCLLEWQNFRRTPMHTEALGVGCPEVTTTVTLLSKDLAIFMNFRLAAWWLCQPTGELLTSPGTLDNPDEGYRSRFDKKDEHSEPGYYSVITERLQH